MTSPRERRTAKKAAAKKAPAKKSPKRTAKKTAARRAPMVLEDEPTGPEPLRALGQVGKATWDDLADQVPDADRHLLQLLCEQLDDRAALRIRVLQQTADPLDVRRLDAQIAKNLQAVRDAMRAAGTETRGSAFDELAERRARRRADADPHPSAAPRSQPRRRS